MITKQKAIEVLSAPGSQVPAPRHDVELLDRANAFPDESTLAEIESVARVVLVASASGHDNAWNDTALWRNAALRLATACRKLGFTRVGEE